VHKLPLNFTSSYQATNTAVFVILVHMCVCVCGCVCACVRAGVCVHVCMSARA
jgi:hypothetical protein